MEDIQVFLEYNFDNMLVEGLFGDKRITLTSPSSHTQPTYSSADGHRDEAVQEDSALWRGFREELGQVGTSRELRGHQISTRSLASGELGTWEARGFHRYQYSDSITEGILDTGSTTSNMPPPSQLEEVSFDSLKLPNGTGHLMITRRNSSTPTLASVDIARRSQGMFLWSRLLVNLLYSPALTPWDRQSILLHIHLVDGIEQLYRKILERIGHAHAPDRAFATNTFRWTACSLYPLQLEALQTALAIVPGRRISKANYILEFQKSLPLITCALTEITTLETVRFIHSSFKDYLESLPTVSEFSLKDHQGIHRCLATSCISYLDYDIPKRPLHDSSETPLRRQERDMDLPYTAEERRLAELSLQNDATLPLEAKKALIKARNPLLQYAALCWAEHLYRGLPDPDQITEYCIGINRQLTAANALSRLEVDTRIHSDASEVAAQVRSFHSTCQPPLSRFLLNRKGVTAWVEACFTFGYPPNLERIRDGIEKLVSVIHPNSVEDRDRIWMSHGLHQLTEALRSISRHSAQLIAEPMLIWSDEIRYATDPYYWPVWQFRNRLRLGQWDEELMVPAAYRPSRDIAARPFSGLVSLLSPDSSGPEG